VSARRRWTVRRAAWVWLTGPYFPRQLRDFVLLWAVFKGVNIVTAIRAGVPPLGFRPATEVVALGFECAALLVFARRARELVPAANAGMSVPLLLLPFAVLHTALGLVLTAFA
jgi:hypothetical protein